jgi:hypothetical protein
MGARVVHSCTLSDYDYIENMRKWWFVLILLFSAASIDTEYDACQKEIEQIDLQIQKLEKQKQKHIDRARHYQTEGDRWQYKTGRIDDAHADWGKADNERAQAIALQRQIDLLLEKKDRIYQYYPLLQPSTG